MQVDPEPTTALRAVETRADFLLGNLPCGTTGITDGDRAGLDERGGVVQHLSELLRARWCEHPHAGNLRQQRHVVHAVVACPVRTGDTGTVETEDDRKAMECDVVDDLIPCPVEERRVDRHHGAKATHRHAGSAGDGMLLGDADVEEPVGVALLERQQTRRARHCGSQCHDAIVGLGLFQECVGKGLGVAGGDRLRRADQRIEDRRVMEVLLVIVLRRRVAATLLREHVHEDRPLLGELDRITERVLHLLDVVAVERADVAHTERLEERRWLKELADPGLERIHRRFGLMADHREVTEELLEATLAAHVHRVGANVGERVRQLVGHPIGDAGMVGLLVATLRAGGQHRHRGGIGAAVVVEDDDDLLVAVTDVVDRLVGHATGE